MICSSDYEEQDAYLGIWILFPTHPPHLTKSPVASQGFRFVYHPIFTKHALQYRIAAPQPPQRLDGLRPDHAGHWFGGLRAVWALAPCTASCGQGGVGDRGFKFPNQGSLQLNVRGAGTLLFTNMCISYLGYLGDIGILICFGQVGHLSNWCYFNTPWEWKPPIETPQTASSRSSRRRRRDERTRQNMPEPLDVIASPLTDFGACTHWSADEWNVHDLLLLIEITPELTDPRNTKQVDQHPSGCLGRCCRVCIASAYQDT